MEIKSTPIDPAEELEMMKQDALTLMLRQGGQPFTALLLLQIEARKKEQDEDAALGALLRRLLR